MNNSGLVSIIVPVYGVESYLPECIDSLLAQTYENLEILLVDDGSPDHCPAICDDYAARDKRIRVIHKENGGAASARNVGLDMAQGDFVSLIDSDDWISPYFIEHLLKMISDTGSDISVCSFYYVFQNKKEENPVIYPHMEIMSQESYLRRFLSDWTCGMATTKLFKVQIIENVRYEEGHKIDDEFFTYQAVMNSSQVVLADEPLYMYRVRASSVMQEFGTNSEHFLLDKIEYTQQRYHKVAEAFPSLRSAFFDDLADSFTRYWLSCRNMPAAERRIRQWARTNLRAILASDMSFKQKMIILSALFLRRAGSAANEKPPARSTTNYFP